MRSRRWYSGYSARAYSATTSSPATPRTPDAGTSDGLRPLSFQHWMRWRTATGVGAGVGTGVGAGVARRSMPTCTSNHATAQSRPIHDGRAGSAVAPCGGVKVGAWGGVPRTPPPLGLRVTPLRSVGGTRLLHEVGKECDLLLFNQDYEGWREAKQGGIFAEHARADRVERARPYAVHPAVGEGAHTQLELLRCVVGECDYEDACGVLTLVEQVGEARAEASGLAGPRRSEQENRITIAANGLRLLLVGHCVINLGVHEWLHQARKLGHGHPRRGWDRGVR